MELEQILSIGIGLFATSMMIIIFVFKIEN
jgi:hypothetical protein